jgi:hypothetical protein
MSDFPWPPTEAMFQRQRQAVKLIAWRMCLFPETLRTMALRIQDPWYDADHEVRRLLLGSRSRWRYGRLTETSKTLVIPPDHFLGNVTIDRDRQALVPSARSVLTESEQRSRSMFCRIFFAEPGATSVGKCSSARNRGAIPCMPIVKPETEAEVGTALTVAAPPRNQLTIG